jgi:surface antigen
MSAAVWFVAPASSALADTGGYPYANATNCSATFGVDSWCINGNDISRFGYGYRNCTDYVAWKIQQALRVTLPKTLGNANTWGPRLKQDGYSYDTSPEVGDIAAWNSGGGGFGHVAYVFAVNGGIGSLDEYNVRNTGLFTSNRTTAANSAGAPSEYVHVGPISGYEMAFQANTGSLWSVGEDMHGSWSQVGALQLVHLLFRPSMRPEHQRGTLPG